MTNVKTTKIEKKYTDKKTGQPRSITIEHAKVKDRLKAFWEAHPHGSIDTSQQRTENQIIFKAHIIADKSDEFSREATGHSYGNIGEDKSFEKLETIAVGRALALLGYATDGEIASLEEMEEFESYKNQKKEESIILAKEKLEECNTIEELQEVWISLGSITKEQEVVDYKDSLIEKIK